MRESDLEVQRQNKLNKERITELSRKAKEKRLKEAREFSRGNRVVNLKKTKHFSRGPTNLFVVNLLKYVDLQKDGIYFVIFFLSILADLITLAEAIVSASLAVIPFGGWVLDALFSAPFELLVIAFSVVIAILYLLAGHYKTRKKALRIFSVLGFDLLEMVPLLSVLPGFTISFIINYLSVLAVRAKEDARRWYNLDREVLRKKLEIQEKRKRLLRQQSYQNWQMETKR